MNDRTYTSLVTVVGILAGLYFFLKGNKAGNTVLISGGGNVPAIAPFDPAAAMFANNPGAFTPQAIGAQTINIDNQGLSYLSNKYIPLFGFVGMASGGQSTGQITYPPMILLSETQQTYGGNVPVPSAYSAPAQAPAPQGFNFSLGAGA